MNKKEAELIHSSMNLPLLPVFISIKQRTGDFTFPNTLKYSPVLLLQLHNNDYHAHESFS